MKTDREVLESIDLWWRRLKWRLRLIFDKNITGEQLADMVELLELKREDKKDDTSNRL